MFKKGMRVVFAFSDTAGTNACLAQAFILKKEKNCSVSCLSNKQNFQATPWSLPVQHKEKVTESDLENVDVLFTGTSHPDSSLHFELQAIQLAKEKKIYSIAYVDHWTNIKVRFGLKGEMVLPNEIWVPDKTAQGLAMKEGIPESLIRIKKNPYLVYLSTQWRSVYPNKEYAKKLDLSSNKKVIVIAPDPISIRTKDFDPGFTEVSALNDLLRVVNEMEIQSQVVIVIKAHPLQPLELLNPVIDQYQSLGLTIKLLTQSDSRELINLADLVIGFYSNFLLEAHAMDKPVVRYFPGNIQVDPLNHLAHLPSISNPSQALLSLQAIL